MSTKIPVVFHKGWDYDYLFIVQELAHEFKVKFEYLGENTEKYKTFPFAIEKYVKKIDKDGNEDITTVSYKIKFIDSVRFMANSLSNIVDNLAEGTHKPKCKDCNFSWTRSCKWQFDKI